MRNHKRPQRGQNTPPTVYQIHLWLALDATPLRQQHTVLVVSVVLHQTAIPIAWRLLPTTQPHAWRPEWEALLRSLLGQVPASVSMYVLTDRGLWASWLFRAIVRNGWHPLMRIHPNGVFRARWQRQAQPIAFYCPERGHQRAVEGFAFGHRLRCTLVVFWGARAESPWYLLTDGHLSVSEAVEAYRGRVRIERWFRQCKRGGYGWLRLRSGSSVRMSWVWWVYALVVWWSWRMRGRCVRWCGGALWWWGA